MLNILQDGSDNATSKFLDRILYYVYIMKTYNVFRGVYYIRSIPDMTFRLANVQYYQYTVHSAYYNIDFSVNA